MGQVGMIVCHNHLYYLDISLILPVCLQAFTSSVSCRTTSQTFIVSQSRTIHEVVHLSLFQDNFNAELVICEYIPLVRPIFFGFSSRFTYIKIPWSLASSLNFCWLPLFHYWFLTDIVTRLCITPSYFRLLSLTSLDKSHIFKTL